jgi:hypothetical protein
MFQRWVLPSSSGRCLHRRPDNAGSTHLWNGLLQRHYTALYRRRRSPWCLVFCFPHGCAYSLLQIQTWCCQKQSTLIGIGRRFTLRPILSFIFDAVNGLSCQLPQNGHAWQLCHRNWRFPEALPLSKSGCFSPPGCSLNKSAQQSEHRHQCQLCSLRSHQDLINSVHSSTDKTYYSNFVLIASTNTVEISTGKVGG